MFYRLHWVTVQKDWKNCFVNCRKLRNKSELLQYFTWYNISVQTTLSAYSQRLAFSLVFWNIVLIFEFFPYTTLIFYTFCSVEICFHPLIFSDILLSIKYRIFRHPKSMDCKMIWKMRKWKLIWRCLFRFYFCR